MWRAIKAAIETWPRTIRFLLIVLILAALYVALAMTAVHASALWFYR
jgi:hypothetical protein